MGLGALVSALLRPAWPVSGADLRGPRRPGIDLGRDWRFDHGQGQFLKLGDQMP